MSAAVLAASVALSSCAMGGVGGGKAGPSVNPSAEVSGEITVWSWDTAAAALKRLGKDYQAAHPNTTINVVDVGYDNAYDKLSVGLQANSGLPDIVTIESERATGYIVQFPKGLTNLNPVLGDKKADFDPSKWVAGSNDKGEIMVAPWDSGTVGLYYRSDYFSDAGIDPASVTTWDDLVKAGETIKKKSGHTLMSVDISGGAGFSMMLQQQGLSYFNEAGEVTVNSPEAVKTLALLQDMQNKGLLKNVRGWDAAVTSAKNGDSAVKAEAVWWIGTLKSEMPELKGKFGVVVLPEFAPGGARTSNNGGSGLAVPTQSKNPDLAASFVAWVLADKDNQVSMMKQEGLFPSYLPALQDSYFTEPDPYFSDQKVLELFAEQTANIPPITFTSDTAKASDIVSNAVQASLLDGVDPQQALDDAAQQIANATGRKIAG